MPTKERLRKTFSAFILIFLFLSACNSVGTSTFSVSTSVAVTTVSVTATSTPVAATIPDWYGYKMTDVRTGDMFTINDFAGKVVLIEAIAEWCPNCLYQQAEMRKLSKQLSNPEDLILISLDVDLNEDEASLKKYAEDFGFEWRFAVASLEVQHDMANLYSPQYHNPPLDPMLLIDRQGNAHQLPYNLKKVVVLQEIVGPYLVK